MIDALARKPLFSVSASHHFLQCQRALKEKAFTRKEGGKKGSETNAASVKVRVFWKRPARDGRHTKGNTLEEKERGGKGSSTALLGVPLNVPESCPPR